MNTSIDIINQIEKPNRNWRSFHLCFRDFKSDYNGYLIKSNLEDNFNNLHNYFLFLFKEKIGIYFKTILIQEEYIHESCVYDLLFFIQM